MLPTVEKEAALAGNVRVFLVDDHEVVRAGVRSLLDTEEDIEVVGEAANAADARRSIVQHLPDVVIMDVRLPDGSGVEVCRDVRDAAPDVKVLILTSFADDEALFESILAGASGFLLKQVRGADLPTAIRRIASGESLLDAAIHDRVIRRLRGEDGDEEARLLGSLTEKEREILDLIAHGMTNRQIADEVHLAEKTIKNYVSSILTKIGVSRRAEAAALMARRQERRGSGSGEPTANWP